MTTAELETTIVADGHPYWEGYEEDVCERIRRVTIAAYQAGSPKPSLRLAEGNPHGDGAWEIKPTGYLTLYVEDGKVTDVSGRSGGNVPLLISEQDPVAETLKTAASKLVGPVVFNQGFLKALKENF